MDLVLSDAVHGALLIEDVEIGQRPNEAHKAVVGDERGEDIGEEQQRQQEERDRQRAEKVGVQAHQAGEVARHVQAHEREEQVQ